MRQKPYSVLIDLPMKLSIHWCMVRALGAMKRMMMMKQKAGENTLAQSCAYHYLFIQSTTFILFLFFQIDCQEMWKWKARRCPRQTPSYIFLKSYLHGTVQHFHWCLNALQLVMLMLSLLSLLSLILPGMTSSTTLDCLEMLRIQRRRSDPFCTRCFSAAQLCRWQRRRNCEKVGWTW